MPSYAKICQDTPCAVRHVAPRCWWWRSRSLWFCSTKSWNSSGDNTKDITTSLGWSHWSHSRDSVTWIKHGALTETMWKWSPLHILLEVHSKLHSKVAAKSDWDPRESSQTKSNFAKSKEHLESGGKSTSRIFEEFLWIFFCRLIFTSISMAWLLRLGSVGALTWGRAC